MSTIKVTDSEEDFIWWVTNTGIAHSGSDELVKISKGGHSYFITNNSKFTQVIGGRGKTPGNDIEMTSLRAKYG